MIRSMTGFASLTREDDHVSLTVTIRSVNHRYLDLQVRAPAMLAELEGRVRTLVQGRVARGRVEVAITAQIKQEPGLAIEVNERALEVVAEALESLRGRGIVTGGLSAGDLLRLPQVVTIRERTAESPGAPPPVMAAVLAAVEAALEQLGAMRTREGAYLRADLDERRAAMARLVDGIAAAAEDGRAAFQTRLADRVRELTGDLQLDAAAVAQEVVRLAARSDISEELVRLGGHLAHWQALADGAEPCGRKLDFLLQEMNREVNTIGSKAEGGLTPELIIEAKAELEKMREQAQNVE